jgi:hypothetical protein
MRWTELFQVPLDGSSRPRPSMHADDAIDRVHPNAQSRSDLHRASATPDSKERQPVKEAADCAGDLFTDSVPEPDSCDYFMRPEGFEPPVSAFGGPRVIQLRYGRLWSALFRFFGRERCGGGHVLEEVELVVDESPVKLANAVGVAEEIGPRIRQIVARRIRNVVRNFDFFHLAAIDRMGAKIAGNR